MLFHQEVQKAFQVIGSFSKSLSVFVCEAIILVVIAFDMSCDLIIYLLMNFRILNLFEMITQHSDEKLWLTSSTPDQTNLKKDSLNLATEQL